MDMDIPSRMEGKLFSRPATKLLWVFLQPLFYAIRPLCLRPKPITSLEIINFSAQIVFDVIIYYTMGYRFFLSQFVIKHLNFFEFLKLSSDF